MKGINHKMMNAADKIEDRPPWNIDKMTKMKYPSDMAKIYRTNNLNHYKKFLTAKGHSCWCILNEGNEDVNDATRQNVIDLMDNFIEKLLQTRRTLVLAYSLSISSIVLAPLAIGLSIFLLLHPSFFVTLENEDEFGIFLSILLAGIIIVSLILLVTGIRLYRSIKPWNKKYNMFLEKKEEIDRKIVSEYDLHQD